MAFDLKKEDKVSLQTLAGELQDFFNDPKMNVSIATPFQRFHRSLRLRPGAICNTTRKEQWKNLPQEIKDVFINAYKKELAKYNLPYAAVTSRMSGPNTISLMKPVDFYVDHGLKTGGTHRNEIKKMSSSLSQEEKLPSIEDAIKVYVEYMKDVMKKEEDSGNRKGLRIYGLTKTDMKFFLMSKGIPERPQKPPLMYIKMLENQGKEVPSLKNFLIDAQRIFAHIKEKEKKKYINMYREEETAMNNVLRVLLDEMLLRHQESSASSADFGLIHELHSSCSTLRANIYRLGSEMDD